MDLLAFLKSEQVALDLQNLILGLSDVCRGISLSIAETGTDKEGSKNAFGEEQLSLDLHAERLFSEHLEACPFVASYASEELPDFVKVHENGVYSVVYDPLDGSSLVDVNFSVGSIVGIYSGAQVLGQTGRSQVAALYAVYGPRTLLILSLGHGAHEFILKNGVFEYSNPLILGEDKLTSFSPGNLRAASEREDYQKLLLNFIEQKATLRYSGGMVPDVHHLLRKQGGVFMYPGMPSSPEGKLRLLFECAPMAFIVEAAGGASSNGRASILELPIENILQRTPVYLGSHTAVHWVLDRLDS